MTDRPAQRKGEIREGSLVLIVGGASSGKSAYAESIAADMAKKEMASFMRGRLFYAATMRRDENDAETCARIERHRKMRLGKGFETIEMERNIDGLKKMLRSGDTVLLEDLSNLLANELFPAEGPVRDDELGDLLREKILDPLFEIKAMGVNTVVVGSRISEDLQSGYEAGTMRFIDGMQYMQREIGVKGDGVWEVVCGIGVRQGAGME